MNAAAEPADRGRPERPAAPPLPPMTSLDRAHREILEILDEAERLLPHLHESGPDDAARAIASRVHGYLDRHARAHHEQEESQVFPPLLARADERLAAHVRRLQQDHGWLEEDWRTIGPQLDAIAQGIGGADLALLRGALPRFAALYREHIALEETVVYPAARRLG